MEKYRVIGVYQAIEVGLNQIENGETITEEEMLEHIRNL
jgi:predicted transcriptional regulator